MSSKKVELSDLEKTVENLQKGVSKIAGLDQRISVLKRSVTEMQKQVTEMQKQMKKLDILDRLEKRLLRGEEKKSIGEEKEEEDLFVPLKTQCQEEPAAEQNQREGSQGKGKVQEEEERQESELKVKSHEEETQKTGFTFVQTGETGGSKGEIPLEKDRSSSSEMKNKPVTPPSSAKRRCQQLYTHQVLNRKSLLNSSKNSKGKMEMEYERKVVKQNVKLKLGHKTLKKKMAKWKKHKFKEKKNTKEVVNGTLCFMKMMLLQGVTRKRIVGGHKSDSVPHLEDKVNFGQRGIDTYAMMLQSGVVKVYLPRVRK